MSNEKKLPGFTVTFAPDGVQVELHNWETGGISASLVERSFYTVHKKIHEFRATSLHQIIAKDAADKAAEAVRDPITEPVK